MKKKKYWETEKNPELVWYACNLCLDNPCSCGQNIFMESCPVCGLPRPCKCELSEEGEYDIMGVNRIRLGFEFRQREPRERRCLVKTTSQKLKDEYDNVSVGSFGASRGSRLAA